MAFEEIGRSESGIDLLVNNAGFGISGAAEFTGTEEAKRLFDVNFFGVLNCTKSAVPLMRRNGGGRIVNVSSVAAVFAIPFQSFYSASKAALNSLTLAVANELDAFGITVCAVMPGDTKTGFTASRVKSELGDDIYGGRISRSVAVMEDDERNGIPPGVVAESIYRIAVKKRVKPLYTLGVRYKILVALQKLLPVGFVNRVVAGLYMK
jgi:short-subunit dehydrogenase